MSDTPTSTNSAAMPSTTASAPPRAERIEGWAQIIILLGMGIMAGAASFTHLHDLTVAHGQPNWFGWVNAVVVELTSVAAGLEIRRRRRTGQPVQVLVVILMFAVLTSLAAQVARAEPSAWGWIVAALPALGFLTSVKIVLARVDHHRPAPGATLPITDIAADKPAPDTSIDMDAPEIPARAIASEGRRQEAPRSGAVAEPSTANVGDARSTPDQAARSASSVITSSATPRQRTDVDRATARSSEVTRPDQAADRPHGRSAPGEPPPHLDHHQGPDTQRGGSGQPPTSTRTRLPHELVTAGRAVVADLETEGRPISRTALITALRDRGHRIGTDRAGDLLKHLKSGAKTRTPRWVGQALRQAASGMT